tara:strand:+ start:4858 stop:5172 length:315 start_codon:yes stop_codon:yes gene_type:complete
MLAVIKTGGKQYIVSPGTKIKVEKLPAEEGKDVVFEEVLLLERAKKVEIGTPVVPGAVVKGKVLKQGKAKKVMATHFKAKKREKKRKGHRQPYTEVEITKIETK